MPLLLSGFVDLPAFLNMVRRTPWPQEPTLMAFAQDRAFLGSYAFDETLLKQSEQGRIFFPDGELKWRRIDGRVQAVFLGMLSSSLELDDCSDELDGLKRETRKLVLWGVRTDLEDEWIEQQVPHRFVYPISGKVFSRGRVNLVIEEWLDPSGTPRFSRYCGLEERPGGHDA